MLSFFQNNASAATGDIEMGIERDQQHANTTEPSQPVLHQSNDETEPAAAIIEKQRETIEAFMAQVSHNMAFDKDVT